MIELAQVIESELDRMLPELDVAPDWDDVNRRLRRDAASRRRRRVAIGLLLLSASAGFAILIARTGSGTASSGLDRASNRGTPIPVTRAMNRSLDRDVDHVALLGVRQGEAFYRLETAGGMCYAIGSTDARPSELLGFWFCPTRSGDSGWPSAAQPVATFATVEGNRANVLHIDGFAADGVAAVEFRDAADAKVAATRVSGNIFNLPLSGQSLNGGRFVARNGDGEIVYSNRY